MNFEVVILPEAEDDMVAIYHYIARHDSIMHAERVLSAFEHKCSLLRTAAERGHGVPELVRIYFTDFREIHNKPYRIIFQVAGERVFVHAVLDGRRELQELLERKLFR